MLQHAVGRYTMGAIQWIAHLWPSLNLSLVLTFNFSCAELIVSDISSLFKLICIRPSAGKVLNQALEQTNPCLRRPAADKIKIPVQIPVNTVVKNSDVNFLSVSNVDCLELLMSNGADHHVSDKFGRQCSAWKIIVYPQKINQPFAVTCLLLEWNTVLYTLGNVSWIASYVMKNGFKIYHMLFTTSFLSVQNPTSLRCWSCSLRECRIVGGIWLQC